MVKALSIHTHVHMKYVHAYIIVVTTVRRDARGTTSALNAVIYKPSMDADTLSNRA